ncbi:hypothetical protein [Massilia endophytica]|uniref:hypothetical protein n=1 Tax=Massilia endophytica TaxID=2899220 RepID=UPI001E2F4295|nr:hypothetical protein [Massilia endophytica]UGQ48731.1 hypothetical protein LSQ66_09800 [Massilia endophytica]
MSSVDVPLRATKGSAYSDFAYGAGRQCVRQTRSDGTEIHYAGALEAEVKGGVTTVKTYWAMGLRVKIERNGATSLNWFFKDRLGSVTGIVDEAGNLIVGLFLADVTELDSSVRQCPCSVRVILRSVQPLDPASNRSHGGRWNAAMITYIAVMPFTGRDARLAEQISSGLSVKALTSAITAKTGVAARQSQSAARAAPPPAVG